MNITGYYQCICEKGHLSIVNKLDLNAINNEKKIDDIQCIWCKHKIIWSNFVDDNNSFKNNSMNIDTYLDDNDFPVVTNKFLKKIKVKI